MRPQAALTSKQLEHSGSGLLDWYDPLLGAFTSKQHLRDRIELKIGRLDTDSFADSGTGLSEEQQKCVVPPSDGRAAIWDFEESTELGATEMVEDWLYRAFPRNGQDPLYDAHCRWIFECYMVEEGANGGQASVSRADARSSYFLDIIEKSQDDWPVEICHTQLTWSLTASSRRVDEQLLQRVSVSGDGSGARAPLRQQALMEERLEQRPQRLVLSFFHTRVPSESERWYRAAATPMSSGVVVK
jgi:hypothetical protein